jgi:hypothetical protein
MQQQQQQQQQWEQQQQQLLHRQQQLCLQVPIRVSVAVPNNHKTMGVVGWDDIPIVASTPPASQVEADAAAGAGFTQQPGKLSVLACSGGRYLPTCVLPCQGEEGSSCNTEAAAGGGLQDLREEAATLIRHYLVRAHRLEHCCL